jgi:hypothetical protein
METLEILNAVASIASSISTVSVLAWWIIVERKRGDQLMNVVLADWQRQREEEIERRAEEKFQRKMSTIPSGGGI